VSANPSDSCIFCKIIAGEIPSPKVHENAGFIVIRDIQPQAKTHLLVIPKKHYPNLVEIPAAEAAGIHAGILGTALEAAEKEGMTGQGFRTVINTRDWGGQSVHHLHLHLLGGAPLSGKFA
jgi:histidine triad (HIT) family protein